MFEHYLTPPSIQGDRYIPRQKVGEGRSGAVYLGYSIEDVEQTHPLAIRFPTVCSSSQQRSDLIKKQATLLQQLISPHTPQYIDHSEHTVCPYLILEFIPETLSDRVAKNTLTQTIFIEYLTQIPHILAFLQDKNVVHGDLKCGNLGVIENTLKMLDIEDMRKPGNYKIPQDAPIYYPFEFCTYGNLTLESDTYTAGRNLEYMLTAQYGYTTEETFETIELLHNLSLPNSFKEVYLALTNREPTNRPTPTQLPSLFQPLIRDIQHHNLFHPISTADIELPKWF